MFQEPSELVLKRSILSRSKISCRQLLDWCDKRFGYEPAAKGAVIAARVRVAPSKPFVAHMIPFAAAMNARMRAWSLIPGCVSTPDATSTPYGRTTAMASATFSAV